MSYTDHYSWFPVPSAPGPFDTDGGDLEQQYATTTTPFIIDPYYPLPEPTVPSSFYHGGFSENLPLSTNSGLQVDPILDVAANNISQASGITEEPTVACTPMATYSSVFMQGTHMLSNSIINNPIMIDGNIDKSYTDREMMKLLEQKAMVDATFDSCARQYTAPHCHSETRVPLREKATAWIEDINREEPLFWLYGPAGAGKSAIAQFLMEYCAKHDFLAAGLFLSRANKRNDASRIIPSLVHQLALAFTPYRKLVTHLLENNPSILHKRMSIQFDQLIDKPATIFKAADSQGRPKPVLLLLDGLDECDNEAAQREIIQLILPFSIKCKTQRIPLVWIVTSRPEWQIVSTFDDFDSELRREELLMDTPEARRDVAIVLRDGFTRIRKKYSDAFSADDEWPTDTQLHLINSAASGNMLLASIVVDFVDNDDPPGNLDQCLKFFEGKLTSNERNPFDPLAAFYRGVLLGIPPTLLRKTLLILYFEILARENGVTASSVLEIASFFLIDQATFYNCMRRLRSVLCVPSPTDTESLERYRGIEFSHASFSDYLKVSLQAGNFGFPETDVHEDIRARCIQWYIVLTDIKLGRRSVDYLSNKLFEHQIRYATPIENRTARTQPFWPRDHQLLSTYASLVSSWGASLVQYSPSSVDYDFSAFYFYPIDKELEDVHAASIIRDIQWSPVLGYFFLGIGPKTALVVACPGLMNGSLYWQQSSRKIEDRYSSQLGVEGRYLLYRLITTTQDQCDQNQTGELAGRDTVSDSSLACTVVSFIYNSPHCNPTMRLKVVIDAISATNDSTNIIQRLSRAIFLEIPREIFRAARQILAFFICCEASEEEARMVHSQDLANFLELDLEIMHKALHWLSPFIYWWSPSCQPQSIFMEMHIIHFNLHREQFVSHWSVSNQWKEIGHDPFFCLDEEACIQIFEAWTRGVSRSLKEGLDFFPNSPYMDDFDFLLQGWSAIYSIHTSRGFTRVLNALSEFPFCRLIRHGSPFGELMLRDCTGFSELVYRLSDPYTSGNIIRTQPICEMDELLLKRFEKELELWDYEYEFAEFPMTRLALSEDVRFGLVSLCPEDPSSPEKCGEDPESSEAFHIFFLGYGENTCLITMFPLETWDEVKNGGMSESQKDVQRDEVKEGIQEKIDNDCRYRDPPRGPWSWNMSVNQTE
ncbi:hypothetical protein NP233_g7946 [Leucocoprinus birnbaumii]|uniref:NACHT domain-containing protein n=1 Tax=Leucocoprinus birnbaumii TaxID=56174 RepID=A0AAD5YNJ4_9AGAR|nr:hypothetical protein NP233_g7946 [Leucocoprinus birnbaumii]